MQSDYRCFCLSKSVNAYGTNEEPRRLHSREERFLTSVVEAATAIPAFIGITEKAVNGSESLANKPWKITSMTEFVQYFGGAPKPVFNLSIATDSNNALYCKEIVEGQYFKVSKPSALYTLYYNMVMFFANGGGTCYCICLELIKGKNRQ